jgi:predicted membrane channel-forming protein YqfA (hemolysin III family)
MLGGSAAGTILLWCRGRDFLRRLDQSAIFLMIAATYTPVHHALPQGGVVDRSYLVWGCHGGIALETVAAGPSTSSQSESIWRSAGRV